MSKISDYQAVLQSIADWDEFLLKESGLPGPRGNIELAKAVAIEGDRMLFDRYLAYDPRVAPVNSPYEFLAFCGALGLGRLLAEGDMSLFARLRQLAADPRWRMREAVAMALQSFGEVDMDALVDAMKSWAEGAPLEQRAAAAALCEPRLLNQEHHARQTLVLLDKIMITIEADKERKSSDFIALKKGLGYCWSVAVAALPNEGEAYMEIWLTSPDKDIQWIMQENLKKNRLLRMDPDWVKKWLK